MNILCLALDIDLTNQRGDSVHVRELVRALGARGNLVSLVTATPKPTAAGLGPNVRHYSRSREGDPATLLQCAAIARAEKADIVYERRLSPKISFGVSRLMGIPFVVEVNGVEADATLQGRPPTSQWWPVRRRLRYSMYRKAALVIAVSSGLGAYILAQTGIPQERLVIVPNGVDTDHFSPLDPALSRRRTGLSDSQWVVFVGNLVPWQGLDTAVRAMPHVLAAHPTARLAIVGGGMLHHSLEQLGDSLGVRPAMTITGWIRHEDVPAYIGASDVCIAPFTKARNEAIGLSPLKIFEYMACGRPIVASKIPGVSELIEQSGCGVVIAPDDPKALAAATSQFLSNREEGSTIGMRGRRFVVAGYTWSKTAEKVEKALYKALDAA